MNGLTLASDWRNTDEVVYGGDAEVDSAILRRPFT